MLCISFESAASAVDALVCTLPSLTETQVMDSLISDGFIMLLAELIESSPLLASEYVQAIAIVLAELETADPKVKTGVRIMLLGHALPSIIQAQNESLGLDDADVDNLTHIWTWLAKYA
jgi:hypothetical protein